MKWRRPPSGYPSWVNVTDKTCVSAAAHVAIKPLEKRAVVVDLNTGQCWELNEVAFAIWQLLTTGASVGKTAEEISARYGVAQDVSQLDVLTLVRSLADQRLVVIQANGP